MTTEAKIDKALKKAGIVGEIFRGDGYLYFSGDSFDNVHTEGIYGFMYFNQLTAERAVSIALDKINGMEH